LEQVARDLAGTVKLAKVDVDAAPKTAARFAVQAIPTLLLMSGGEVKARRTGAVSAAVIRQWVTDTIGASASGP
jgi:thioredoxin 2